MSDCLGRADSTKTVQYQYMPFHSLKKNKNQQTLHVTFYHNVLLNFIQGVHLIFCVLEGKGSAENKEEDTIHDDQF